MIEIKNLSFGYGKKKEYIQLINSISLTVQDGEFIAITGENGAGKSTLSKLIAGLLKPVEGSVSINGMDTKKESNSTIARQVGFLFQNPDRQLCCYTIRDEIAFGQKALKLGTEQEIAERTEAIVQKFSFNPEEAPFTLSRGQRQRLALASIIAVQPRIMILDEPTTGLDYKECMEIMHQVKELNRNGTTVIMVCHDMELVLDFADRMILLSRGTVIADGKTREIMQQPELLAKASLLPPQIIQLQLALKEKYGVTYPEMFTDQDFTPEGLAQKVAAAAKKAGKN